MNENLPDYYDGVFKTQAYCQLLSEEDDLKERLLSVAETSSLFDDNKDRWDLFPFYSILVSTGWNKNTDIFDPIELWRARHSPEDKSVNVMHQQSNIIGHITRNITVGEDLKPIPENTEEDNVPVRLHIITSSVIYKFWEDPQKQSEMNKILADVDTSKFSVSMECLFKNFDYVLMNAKGEQRLLPRTPETAFLTKHLRQYGGTGTYQEYTMGRLLRNITFSAQGLVNKPANPESIISKNLNIFSDFRSLGYITLDSLDRENSMTELELQAKYDKLEKSYNELHAKAEDMKSKLDEVHTSTLAEKDEELKKEKEKKAEAERTVESLKQTIAEKEKEVEKKEKEMEDAKCSLTAELEAERKTREAYEEAGRKSKRTESLLVAEIKDMDKTKAVSLVEKFKDLSDDSFSMMVTTLASYAIKAPKPVTTEQVLTPVHAEESPALGVAAPVSDFEKTAAQVKDWFTSKKGS